MKKRIALLHFAYPPAIGGVEFLLREHAQLLHELGYQVTVITGSGKEEHTDIKLIEVPEFQSIQNINPSLQENIFSGILDEEFETLKKKIASLLELHLKEQETIIIHNMATVSRNLAFMSALREYTSKHSEKKFIIYVHDHMYIGQEEVKDINKTAHSLLEKELLTNPYPNCTYVAISQTLKKLLLEIMPIAEEKIHVVPNGISLKSFLEIDDTVWQFAERYELLEHFPIVLSPVNILKRKNLMYAVEVIAELKKHFPQIRHIISGKASLHRDTKEYYEALKLKIQKLGLTENMVFLSDSWHGSLLETELHDLYSISDCVFYFSKSENFGLPLLESAFSKIPIFTSNLEVFHEILGDIGMYFDTESLTPQQTAEQILPVLNSKTVQLNYHIRTNFRLSKVVETYLVPLL